MHATGEPAESDDIRNFTLGNEDKADRYGDISVTLLTLRLAIEEADEEEVEGAASEEFQATGWNPSSSHCYAPPPLVMEGTGAEPFK